MDRGHKIYVYYSAAKREEIFRCSLTKTTIHEMISWMQKTFSIQTNGTLDVTVRETEMRIDLSEVKTSTLNDLGLQPEDHIDIVNVLPGGGAFSHKETTMQ